MKRLCCKSTIWQIINLLFAWNQTELSSRYRSSRLGGVGGFKGLDPGKPSITKKKLSHSYHLPHFFVITSQNNPFLSGTQCICPFYYLSEESSCLKLGFQNTTHTESDKKKFYLRNNSSEKEIYQPQSRRTTGQRNSSYLEDHSKCLPVTASICIMASLCKQFSQVLQQANSRMFCIHQTVRVPLPSPSYVLLTHQTHSSAYFYL